MAVYTNDNRLCVREKKQRQIAGDIYKAQWKTKQGLRHLLKTIK